MTSDEAAAPGGSTVGAARRLRLLPSERLVLGDCEGDGCVPSVQGEGAARP
jgi:hypothetical protein